MSQEELAYAGNYNTHVDFLVINSISKKPVLAIETDGYSFHNDATEQHQRDKMKDHIFALYSLPSRCGDPSRKEYGDYDQ